MFVGRRYIPYSCHPLECAASGRAPVFVSGGHDGRAGDCRGRVSDRRSAWRDPGRCQRRGNSGEDHGWHSDEGDRQAGRPACRTSHISQDAEWRGIDARPRGDDGREGREGREGSGQSGCPDGRQASGRGDPGREAGGHQSRCSKARSDQSRRVGGREGGGPGGNTCCEGGSGEGCPGQEGRCEGGCSGEKHCAEAGGREGGCSDEERDRTAGRT